MEKNIEQPDFQKAIQWWSNLSSIDRMKIRDNHLKENAILLEESQIIELWKEACPPSPAPVDMSIIDDHLPGDDKEKHTQGKIEMSPFKFGFLGQHFNNPLETIGICQVFGSGIEAEANAARIVTSWNCHDDLVNALKDAFATLLRWSETNAEEWDERDDTTLENIKQAIEKVYPTK